MAPTRNPFNPVPRAYAAPYMTRARRSAESSINTSSSIEEVIKDTSNDDDHSPNYTTTGRASWTTSAEICTQEQTVALTKLIWRAKGFPTLAQKKEISARMTKSLRSINIWMQNYRRPGNVMKTPCFGVRGYPDPESDMAALNYPYDPTRSRPEAAINAVEAPVDSLATQPDQMDPTVETRVAPLHNYSVLFLPHKAVSKRVRKAKGPSGNSGSKSNHDSKKAAVICSASAIPHSQPQNDIPPGPECMNIGLVHYGWKGLGKLVLLHSDWRWVLNCPTEKECEVAHILLDMSVLVKRPPLIESIFIPPIHDGAPNEAPQWFHDPLLRRKYTISLDRIMHSGYLQRSPSGQYFACGPPPSSGDPHVTPAVSTGILSYLPSPSEPRPDEWVDATSSKNLASVPS